MQKGASSAFGPFRPSTNNSGNCSSVNATQQLQGGEADFAFGKDKDFIEIFASSYQPRR